jgi:hypothetical protein
MKDHNTIKTFAQKTLGCGCPEEVFKYIECRSDTALDGFVLRNWINIGNRLLIYVVEADNFGSLKQMLPVLIAAGRKERDEKKFNRLRIVLAADDIDEVSPIANSIFDNADKDDKVHLHIILKKDIPLPA